MSLAKILKFHDTKVTPHHKELEEQAKREEAITSRKVTMPDGSKATVVQVDLSAADGGIGEAINNLLSAAGIKRKNFEEGVKFIERMATNAKDAVENAKLSEEQRDLLMLGFSENFRRFAGCVVNGHTTATEAQVEQLAELADKFFDYGNDKETLGKGDYLIMLGFILG